MSIQLTLIMGVNIYNIEKKQDITIQLQGTFPLKVTFFFAPSPIYFFFKGTQGELLLLC